MTALYNPAAGDEPTAAQLATWKPVFARRTSTSTPVNNSTVFVNDSQLLLPLAASAVYELRGNILYTTNSTATIKFGWTFPTGTTMHYLGSVIPSGQTTWQSFSLIQTDVLAADESPSIARVEGLVIVSTTAGNLQLQFAQNTANASNTTLNADSYLVLTQVE